MNTQPITIEVNNERGFVHMPYPYSFGPAIAALAGRKRYATNGIHFMASPANIRHLKSIGFDLNFIDDGSLAEQENLENLPTQYCELGELNTSYEPKLPFFPRQLETLKQCYGRKVFAHLHDPDYGKTAIMVSEAGMLYLDNKITGVLITSPLGVHTQWCDEQIPAHLDEKIKRKTIIWEKKPIDMKFLGNPDRLEFLSMNHDCFIWPKGKNAATEFIKKHNGNVLMLIDESHYFMNWKAKRTQAIHDIAHMCKYRRIATGTLIAKSLMDAWAQFKLLDWRILGHKYQTGFRSQFCIMGGFEGRQIVGTKNEKDFWQLLAPHCYRASEEEKPDHKKSIVIDHKYKMDRETKHFYKQMKDFSFIEMEGETICEAENPLVQILRLQQILCGYVHTDETKKPYHFSLQRINFCVDLITEKIKDQVIIWCLFVPDRPVLKMWLERKGLKVAIYQGSEKKKSQIKRDFLAQKYDVLIAHPRSGGVGLNLQGNCVNDIYYSYGHNSIDHWQSLKRIDRRGAKGRVTHHRIVCEASTNVGVLASLARKHKTKKLSLDDIRMIIAGTYKGEMEPEKKAVDATAKELEYFDN